MQLEKAATHGLPGEYVRRTDEANVAPLWNVLSSLVTPEPRSDCKPAIWRYSAVRNLLMEAGEIISAEDAERRVLILENPGLRGKSRITTSLYAGLQLVLPGEVAPPHRHSQSALRFVLEGEGGHTTVDGEKVIMKPGDFVLTPAGSWHDHGNKSDNPMIWLDGLDIPVASFLDASFAEGGSGQAQEVRRSSGSSVAMYGENLLPVDYHPSGMNSPMVVYPYERTRSALDRMKDQTEPDACHGFKMRYANPANGDSPMATIGAFIQLLPKGFTSSQYRSTDATIFVPIEGRGATTIGGKTFEWGPRDVFVVPSWHYVSHSAEDDAVLFSYSDRPMQQKLGFWREDRGNA